MTHDFNFAWTLHGYWALAALAVISLIVRLYRLGSWSFWIDEIFSVQHALDGLHTGRRAIQSAHPLYYWCLMFVFRRWGVSERSARMVSACVGAVSAPLLSFAYKPILGEGAAILLGALFAISPWHIYWSQNARFYTITLLCQSLAILSLYYGWVSGDGLGLLTFWGFYTVATLAHETSAMSLIVIAVYLIGSSLLSITPPAGALAAGWVWLALAAAAFTTVAFVFVLGGGVSQRLDKIRTDWHVHYSRPVARPGWVLAGALRYIGLPVVGVSLVYVMANFSTLSHFDLLMLAQATVPIVLATVGAQFFYSTNRYAFLVLPSFLYFSVRGVTQAADSAAWVGITVLTVLILVAYDDLLLYYFTNHGNRERWREILAHVAGQIRERDSVFSTMPTIASFYLQRPVRWLGEESPETLEQLAADAWFVVDNSLAQAPSPVQAWIAERTNVVASDMVKFHTRTFALTVRRFQAETKA